MGQIDSFCPNTNSKISFSVTKFKFLIIAAAINKDFTVIYYIVSTLQNFALMQLAYI